MADNSNSQGLDKVRFDENGDEGGPSRDNSSVRERERLVAIANVDQVMRKVSPRLGKKAKISQSAKELMQKCVSEFICFVTNEAHEQCLADNRKSVTGDDLLSALSSLGFDDYVPPLTIFLERYREWAKKDKGSNIDKPVDENFGNNERAGPSITPAIVMDPAPVPGGKMPIRRPQLPQLKTPNIPQINVLPQAMGLQNNYQLHNQTMAPGDHQMNILLQRTPSNNSPMQNQTSAPGNNQVNNYSPHTMPPNNYQMQNQISAPGNHHVNNYPPRMMPPNNHQMQNQISAPGNHQVNNYPPQTMPPNNYQMQNQTSAPGNHQVNNYPTQTMPPNNYQMQNQTSAPGNHQMNMLPPIISPDRYPMQNRTTRRAGNEAGNQQL